MFKTVQLVSIALLAITFTEIVPNHANNSANTSITLLSAETGMEKSDPLQA